MKIRRDEAVTQMIGTVLLILIAVACVSLVYMYVASYPLPNPAPLVEIVGKLEEDIVLTHRGGESLPLDLKVLITIGSTVENTTVGEHLDDKARENGAWDIGEQLFLPYTSITRITIIDTISDSVIFIGIFK